MVIIVVDTNVVLVPLEELHFFLNHSSGHKRILVGMSVQLCYLVVDVVGKIHKGKVVKEHRPTIYEKDFLECNLTEPPVVNGISQQPVRIVVSKYEVDIAVKYPGLQELIALLNAAETEIAKMIDMVILPDNGVPVINQRLVHFLNGVPGSCTVL